MGTHMHKTCITEQASMKITLPESHFKQNVACYNSFSHNGLKSLSVSQTHRKSNQQRRNVLISPLQSVCSEFLSSERMSLSYKVTNRNSSNRSEKHYRTVKYSSEGGDGEKGERKGVGTVTEEKREEQLKGLSQGQRTDGGGDNKGDGDQKNEKQAFKNLQFDSYSVLELLGPEKVDQDDVKLLRNKVFGYTTFWVTGQEPFGDAGEGVLLLGNLRGNREEVFARTEKAVGELFGDKYDLFMVEEPNAEEGDGRGGPRVSFVLLRKEVSLGSPTKVWQYIIAFVLGIVTAGACLELGLASQISRLPPEVVQYFTDPNPETLDPPDLEILAPYVQAALPLAYGVFGVQLFHELGHRLAAARYGVKLGIPYFVPNITVGTFGAVTQLKSPCPDRKAKFDVSMAGPLAGAALSTAMLALGLAISASPEGRGELVQVPSLLFQGSLLMGGLCRAVLGYEAMHAATVSIHPLVIAGWCGLTTTAFNLLPAGCLDGGRSMQAAFGKMALNISGLVTYLLLGTGLVGGTLSLPWGLYILIVQRNQERPALNNVTGVGQLRQGVLVATLTLVFLTLVPMWEQLAEELGVGLAVPLF